MNSCKLNAVVTNLLEQYLSQGAWQEAKDLANDERFKKCCQEDGGEILNLLMDHLDKNPESPSDDNKTGQCESQQLPEKTQTIERLVRATAEYANAQDMIMELLDRLERVESDTVLISLMKGLKVVLLRQPEKKSLSIEWCLTALFNYFKRLTGPSDLATTFTAERCAFLESDEQLARILELHLILLLFLEPIVKMVVAERVQDYTTRTLETTRQNVLIHFLLQMLGTDLNRIYVPYEATSETNTYIRQCRETLTRMLTDLLGADPFFLLPFIEQRIRYPITLTDDFEPDVKSMNVFLLPNKIPVINYGHYYHTLLVHGLAPGNTPKIYKRDHIFTKFLYLITEMIKTEDDNVQMKGIEMGHHLLALLDAGPDNKRSHEYLELNIFEAYFDRMIQLMTYSENEQIRRSAVRYAESMILSFNDRGRMIILENLFSEYEDNKGLSGYLPILYKNMVVEQLNRNAGQLEQELSVEYTGKQFQKMLLKYICKLPAEEKTNILDCSDRILAALNMIRFIVLRDKTNRTTFWDVVKQLEESFLKKLRLAIDLSRAHYVKHKKDIEAGVDETKDSDVGLSMYGRAMPELSQEQKLIAMNSCLNTFDLMDSLLARVNECIQGEKERLRSNQ